MGLSMAPGTPSKLAESVTVMKRTMQDTTIPVCAVKLTKGGKFTALEVPMYPTPASQGLSLFKGWGIVPLVLNPDEDRVDSEVLRRELFTFLNGCRGSNNVSHIVSYYDDAGPDWPGTEQKTLKPVTSS